MSTFNYADYQNAVARAQNNENAVKVGFFKLKNNGDEAIVRFNVSSLDSLQFASVHQLNAATRWMKVSCLNTMGSYQNECPFCQSVAAGNTSISGAKKKVYVQMLVAYKDPTTQSWSTPVPVIWERPAGFSREIACLLNDYGQPLNDRIFKVTRNGEAGNMQTSYSISYIPLLDKPELIPMDFSAFNNFNIAKHSFWEKSREDIEAFLATGSFPQTQGNNAPQASIPNTYNTQPTAAAPVQRTFTQAPAQASYSAPQFTPAQQPKQFVPVTPQFETIADEDLPFEGPVTSTEPVATPAAEVAGNAATAAPTVENRPNRVFTGWAF